MHLQPIDGVVFAAQHQGVGMAGVGIGDAALGQIGDEIEGGDEGGDVALVEGVREFAVEGGEEFAGV